MDLVKLDKQAEILFELEIGVLLSKDEESKSKVYGAVKLKLIFDNKPYQLPSESHGN